MGKHRADDSPGGRVELEDGHSTMHVLECKLWQHAHAHSARHHRKDGSAVIGVHLHTRIELASQKVRLHVIYIKEKRVSKQIRERNRGPLHGAMLVGTTASRGYWAIAIQL